jgi:hypothetical protein
MIRERHGYWNIKECGDVARIFRGNLLVFRRKRCGDIRPRCATNVPRLIDPCFSAVQDREMEEIHAQTKNGAKSAVSE